MRTALLYLFFLVLTIAVEAQAPSSSRSLAAVATNKPRLQKELDGRGFTLGAPVFIRIFKKPAQLELWMEKGGEFHLFRKYKICSFSGTLGPKLKEGDHQAPEGCYFVTPSQMNPNSSYHLSFNLGYPNAYDKQHGRTGSALMVHGNCVSVGCYAMGDEAIEEIWTLCAAAFEKGQPFFRAHCFPFPLTDANLQTHQQHKWSLFWRELQPIYNHFEQKRIPPDVTAQNGRYLINEKVKK
ncbi:MAG: L,D-transpeptidase family protein [Verrucomicrobiales bacterium]